MEKEKRQTREDIIEGIERNFEIVGEYTRLQNDLTVKCLECGEEDTRTASSIINSGCLNCAGENRVYKEDNVRELEKSFEIIGEYDNIVKPLTTKCKKCGYESTKIARTFLLSGCQNCKAIEMAQDKKESEKLEDDAYVESINKELGKEEFIVDKYSRGNSPEGSDTENIILEHVPCGSKFEVSHRQRNVVCNKCNPEKLIAAKWYRKLYDKMKADGYEVLDVTRSDYSPSRSRSTNVLIRHNECGLEYTRNTGTLKRKGGYKCPECYDNKKIKNITPDILNERIKKHLGEEYEYDSEYTNTKEPFNIKHNVCGSVYPARLTNMSMGYGKCKECEKNKS